MLPAPIDGNLGLLSVGAMGEKLGVGLNVDGDSGAF
jgi:hypothetical protein